MTFICFVSQNNRTQSSRMIFNEDFLSVFDNLNNVNIMMLYISTMDQAKKLKFSSYGHLPSINKMFQYRYA